MSRGVSFLGEGEEVAKHPEVVAGDRGHRSDVRHSGSRFGNARRQTGRDMGAQAPRG